MDAPLKTSSPTLMSFSLIAVWTAAASMRDAALPPEVLPTSAIAELLMATEASFAPHEAPERTSLLPVILYPLASVTSGEVALAFQALQTSDCVTVASAAWLRAGAMPSTSSSEVTRTERRCRGRRTTASLRRAPRRDGWDMLLLQKRRGLGWDSEPGRSVTAAHFLGNFLVHR